MLCTCKYVKVSTYVDVTLVMKVKVDKHVSEEKDQFGVIAVPAVKLE